MYEPRVLHKVTVPPNYLAVESLRPGYPRYSALLGQHKAFQNFRRFTRVRMRLLLQKQDEMVVLEETLERIDSQEEKDLFLGCRRRDTNDSRKQVLGQLSSALHEYGKF